MNKKIVIVGTYQEGMNVIREQGLARVNCIVITPDNWHDLRGRKFIEADIVWGRIPEGQSFGPEFWNYLEATLAISHINLAE